MGVFMRDVYVKLYEQTNYGQANHGRLSYDIIKSLNPKSLLDIGCGKGEFCKYIYDNICQEVYGLDFAFEPTLKGPNWINNFAHEIPLQDKSVDVVTSFDTFEHIPEQDIDKTFNEIKRVVKKCCVFNISSYPASKTGLDGDDLHPTLKSQLWWILKIKDIFETDDIKTIVKPIPNTEKKYRYIIVKLEEK